MGLKIIKKSARGEEILHESDGVKIPSEKKLLDSKGVDSDFVKLYLSRWSKQLISLGKESPSALTTLIWMLDCCFSAKFIKSTETAHICCSKATIMSETGIKSSRTVDAVTEKLVDTGFIRIIDMDCGRVYAMNPDLCWKSYDIHKYKSAFNRGKVLGKIKVIMVGEIKKEIKKRDS